MRYQLLAGFAAGLGALCLGCGAVTPRTNDQAPYYLTGTAPYERSACCELEDPTFHHLKVLPDREVERRFRLSVEPVPGPLQAGVPANLKVTIEEPGSMGALGTHPERRANFIIVSENLEEVHHFHPDDLSDWRQQALFEGSFTLPVTFRNGGTHWVIVDFLEKATIIHKAIRLDVQGPPQPPVSVDMDREHAAADLGGHLTTSPERPPAVGLVNGIVRLSLRDGSPVEDLQRHGGALAHVVLVPHGRAQAARHLHGGGEEHGHFHYQRIVPGYAGPKLYFSDSLTEAGRYRVWVQVRRAQRDVQLKFDLETAAPEPLTP